MKELFKITRKKKKDKVNKERPGNGPQHKGVFKMKKADILEIIKKNMECVQRLAINVKELDKHQYEVYMREVMAYDHVINLFTDKKYAERMKEIYIDAETD